MMEQNLGNHPDASASVPVKRRRGRPRKYPRADIDHGRSIHIRRTRSVNHGEYSHTSPGFGEVNKNLPHQVDQVSYGNDAMIGQMVHGIIEAAFEAGYLLTVRVGNSETTLRGVVFKPGHVVPVSAKNDVAPGIQMITRKEIRLPTVDHSQVHGLNPRSTDRNGTAHATPSSNLGAPNSNQVSPMTTETTIPSIPATIHPSDGTEAAHPVPSKGKEVLDAFHPSNGSLSANQVHFQSQNHNTAIPSAAPSETGPSNLHPAEELTKTEAQSTKLHGNLSMKDSGIPGGNDVSDTDQQALSVEPLQAVQPNDHAQPAAISRPPENIRYNELMELFEENLESQATQTEGAAADSRPEQDELASMPELGDNDNGHAEKHA